MHGVADDLAEAADRRFAGAECTDRGARAFGLLYDHLCAAARTLFDAVSARQDFAAIHEPESNILCFRYVGSRREDAGDADALNQRLREAYNRAGDGWITTTMLGGRRVLRVTLMNPRTRPSDLERVLDGLAALGRRLES